MTAPVQQPSTAEQALRRFIATELAQPVSAAALAMSEAIRARHGDAALAVLFYGSCLRQPETQLVDSLLDFYVLVDDYRAAYEKAWLAWANQLLPPNVFYLEIDYGAARLRAKSIVDACIRTAVSSIGEAPMSMVKCRWAQFPDVLVLMIISRVIELGEVSRPKRRFIGPCGHCGGRV